MGRELTANRVRGSKGDQEGGSTLIWSCSGADHGAAAWRARPSPPLKLPHRKRIATPFHASLCLASRVTGYKRHLFLSFFFSASFFSFFHNTAAAPGSSPRTLFLSDHGHPYSELLNYSRSSRYEPFNTTFDRGIWRRYVSFAS